MITADGKYVLSSGNEASTKLSEKKRQKCKRKRAGHTTLPDKDKGQENGADSDMDVRKGNVVVWDTCDGGFICYHSLCVSHINDMVLCNDKNL